MNEREQDGKNERGEQIEVISTAFAFNDIYIYMRRNVAMWKNALMRNGVKSKLKKQHLWISENGR